MAKSASSKASGGEKKKPETSTPRSAICPRCHTMLTRADRIPKTTLQAIFSPSKKRYWCDACGLKFTTSATVSASDTPKPANSHRKNRTSSHAIESDETPPTQKKPQAVKRKNGVAHDGEQRVEKQQAASQAVASEARRANEQTEAASDSVAQELLLKELARLRKVEKKYRALKKVNRYLVKATRRRTSQSRPRR